MQSINKKPASDKQVEMEKGGGGQAMQGLQSTAGNQTRQHESYFAICQEG